MEILVRTNISNEYKNIEVYINSPERNEQVESIEKSLLQAKEHVTSIMGMQNNDIFIIKIKDIVEIYTEDRTILCKTKDGIFNLKEKLYYLEEILPNNDFIRISNSVIININHVKCFNTSIVGKIIVRFKDGSQEYVAKRKTSEIMKFLKERKGGA